MGQDADRDVRLSDLAPYRLDAALLSCARNDAIALHCLPAHRGEEIAGDVLDGPRSAVWEQAANRLPTQQALLHLLLVERASARENGAVRRAADAQPTMSSRSPPDSYDRRTSRHASRRDAATARTRRAAHVRPTS